MFILVNVSMNYPYRWELLGSIIFKGYFFDNTLTGVTPLPLGK